MFNSLKYAKILEGAGLPRLQAEAHMEIMEEILKTNLATTQDLKDLRVELKQDILILDNKISQVEHRLTIKLGTIVSLAIGVAVALAKLI